MKLSMMTAAALSLTFQICALAQNFPLNGYYQATDSSCLEPLQKDLYLPVTVYIHSDSRLVSALVLVDHRGMIGYRNIIGYNMITGTRMEGVMGDGVLKREGHYQDSDSKMEHGFLYTESANSSQNPAFREHLKVELRLLGDTLYFTRSNSKVKKCTFIRTEGPN